MDYRNRCYASYISSHWKNLYSIDVTYYNYQAKFYKARYHSLLPIDKNSMILDVACGNGGFLYYLNSEGYTNCYGIDTSIEQVEAAKKLNIPNIHCGDLFDYLQNHINEFDMIIANDIIEHFTKEEALQFLDAIHESLTPHGSILLSTNNAEALNGSCIVYGDFTHEFGYTCSSLSQVMAICGFEHIEVFGEKPVIYDVKSFIRALLWWGMDKLIRLFLSIYRGAGRSKYKRKTILEPRIFAIARACNK